MICIIILFLISLFMVINIKIVLYLLFINKVKFITNTRQNKRFLRSKELVLCTLITSVFRVLLSNKWWERGG